MPLSDRLNTWGDEMRKQMAHRRQQLAGATSRAPCEFHGSQWNAQLRQSQQGGKADARAFSVSSAHTLAGRLREDGVFSCLI